MDFFLFMVSFYPFIDFGAQYRALTPLRVFEDRSGPVLRNLWTGLVGDALAESFWPKGTGANRAFLSGLNLVYVLTGAVEAGLESCSLDRYIEHRQRVCKVIGDAMASYQLVRESTANNVVANGWRLDYGSRFSEHRHAVPRPNAQFYVQGAVHSPADLALRQEDEAAVASTEARLSGAQRPSGDRKPRPSRRRLPASPKHQQQASPSAAAAAAASGHPMSPPPMVLSARALGSNEPVPVDKLHAPLPLSPLIPPLAAPCQPAAAGAADSPGSKAEDAEPECPADFQVDTEAASAAVRDAARQASTKSSRRPLTSSAPVADPDRSPREQLVSMGFVDSKVDAALELADGDFASALEVLLFMIQR